MVTDRNRLLDLEKEAFSVLEKLQSIMPDSFAKLIALYYPDARIRKLYCGAIGVEMGEGSYANLGLKTTPNANAKVLIGKSVSIAPNVTLITESCANNGIEINTLPYVRDELTTHGDIIIEDDVWIGTGVTILPGIRIGTCSVLGAHSLITSDVVPYSLYVGTPAVRIRDLKTGERVFSGNASSEKN